MKKENRFINDLKKSLSLLQEGLNKYENEEINLDELKSKVDSVSFTLDSSLFALEMNKENCIEEDLYDEWREKEEATHDEPKLNRPPEPSQY